MARKAVLCGINAYAEAPLRGCLHDVESVQGLLLETFGFQPEQIHLLRDAEVVKTALEREWQWLTADAAAGDVLVFHISGHGSSVPDRSGDESGDGRDEITCLADMDFDDPATYISDDEWFRWVEQVPEQARLIVIKDTCHSGGSSRALAVRSADGSLRRVLAQGAFTAALKPGTRTAAAAQAASASRTGRRVLVCVHGISTHRPGWSDPWWAALAPHVGATYGRGSLGEERLEVTWSDLVNRGRAAPRDPAAAAEAQRLREAIEAVIEDRRAQESEPGAAAPPGARGGGLAIDDFLIYMTLPEMRRRILRRFTAVLRPLLADGTTVDLLSHSWGTVVAYEGLRELEREHLGGAVATWFTLGSALSIGPVQTSLRPQNRPADGQRAPYPSLVRSWINLDARGDLVGGPLGSRFPVQQDCTGLLPVGCPRRIWGYDLVCAHGSYFDPANLAVNRDILAAHILGRA